MLVNVSGTEVCWQRNLSRVVWMRRDIALCMMLGLGGTFALAPPASAQEAVALRHVHGLGYSTDGSRLKVASHHGIAIYSDGRWSKARGPAHDYMGFVVTREFIISSGHPRRGSNISDPLGLILSHDRAETWTSVGIEGDFHIVAAGHASNAVYVYSPRPTSRMPRRGIYQMLGEGGEWRYAPGQGLSGELYLMAAHPTQVEMLAAATSAGLFLSEDAGDTFRQIVVGQVTTAFFTLEGDSMWFGVFDGAPRLFHATIVDTRRQEIMLPRMGRDAVAYIAQNPARRAEFAMVTYERSVFLTPDRGKSWTMIARPRGTMP
jgi:hypothetical protein